MHQDFPLRVGQAVSSKFQKLLSSVGCHPTFVHHHKIECPLSIMCRSPSLHCRTNLGTEKNLSLIAFGQSLLKLLPMTRF